MEESCEYNYGIGLLLSIHSSSVGSYIYQQTYSLTSLTLADLWMWMVIRSEPASYSCSISAELPTPRLIYVFVIFRTD